MKCLNSVAFDLEQFKLVLNKMKQDADLEVNIRVELVDATETKI